VYKLRSSVYDQHIRNGVRNKKGVLDILEYEVIKEKWNSIKKDIKDMVDQELAKKQTEAKTAEDKDAARVEEDGDIDGDAPAKKKTRVDGSFNDELRKMMAKELPENKVDMWMEMVRRTFSAHLILLVEPPSCSQLKAMLEGTDACAIKGSPGSSYVGVFYQYPAAAESATAPHRRTAPMQEAHATKCVQAALEARSGDSMNRSIQAGDMYFCNDGGRALNAGKLFHLFKWAGEVAEGEKKPAPMPVKKKMIILSYNEQSVRNQKRNTRSFTGLKTVETLSIMTNNNIDIPMKARKHFTGTNQGHAIENIMLPNMSDTWSTDVKTKKLIYGARRVRVGGPDPEGDDDEGGSDDDQDIVRTDETIEPVFFKNLPRKLIDELVHGFCLSGIVDLTAEAGEKALVAIECGLLYAGVCMTNSHAELWKAHIEKEIWKMFKTEGHTKYQSTLAKLVKDTDDKQKEQDKNKDTRRCVCVCLYLYMQRAQIRALSPGPRHGERARICGPRHAEGDKF
jgi:hypothetical protein